MSNKSYDKKRISFWLDDERTDCCSHVEIDHSLGHCLYSEDDSFGPIERYIACKECADNLDHEEDERTVQCRDCRQAVPQSETRSWRWHDFYAPQGDEPYIICDECWEKPTHQERMKKDALSADEERKYDE